MPMTLDFADDDVAALREFARRTGQSVEDLIRSAVQDHFRRNEEHRQVLERIIEESRSILDRLANE